MGYVPEENSILRLLTDLKSEKAGPFYLIYGDDDYLINNVLHKVIDSILPSGNRELTLFILDGSVENQSAIRELLLTPPLLSGEKVVAVRNAEFLSSGSSITKSVSKILEKIDDDPEKAVRQFMALLKKMGWKLDDLQNGNWKGIPDSEWKKCLTGEELQKRASWLPLILDLCKKHGGESHGESEPIDLEEILRQGIPKGNYLIITTREVDKRKGLYKAFLESGIVLNLSELKRESKQREIAGFISREILAKSGKKLSSRALASLGKRTGFDLSKMSSELEKLASYSGDQSNIDEQDVDFLVARGQENSIFALTGAVSERNTGKALNILKDLLEQDFHYLMIFTMLTREVRLILQAKFLLRTNIMKAYYPSMEYDRFQKLVFPLIKEWGHSERGGNEITSLHPYVLYNALKNSTRFSVEDCTESLESLLETDIALKTTGQSPRLLMEKLIITICGKNSLSRPTDS